jgi:hypothetical protein
LEGGFEAALIIPFAVDALAASVSASIVEPADSRAAAPSAESAAGEPTWSASVR